MLHILFFRFFIQFSRSWVHRAPATSRSHLCLPHISSRAIRLSRCCSLFIHGLRVGGIPPLVGSNGLEPSTSRLSGVRSNHLSYEPISVAVRLPSGQTIASALYRPAPRLPSSSLDVADPRCGGGTLPLVETNRIELSTPCLQGRCSPS